jgi:hypothetical protein
VGEFMVESSSSKTLIWSVLFPLNNCGAPYTAPLVNSRKSEPQRGDLPEPADTHVKTYICSAYLSIPLFHMAIRSSLYGLRRSAKSFSSRPQHLRTCRAEG